MDIRCTLEQAMFLDKLFVERGTTPLVFHLEVPDEILVERVCARRSCPKCKPDL